MNYWSPSTPHISTSLFDWAFQMWVYMYLLSRLVLNVCTVLTQRSLKKLNVITALLLWCVLFYLKFTKLLCWGRSVNGHFFACLQSLMSLSMSHCLVHWAWELVISVSARVLFVCVCACVHLSTLQSLYRVFKFYLLY